MCVYRYMFTLIHTVYIFKNVNSSNFGVVEFCCTLLDFSMMNA